MELANYLRLALERSDASSYRQLGLALGLSHGAISQFRTGRAYPADETMVRLAELAGVDPVKALLDLNTWRAKTPKVQELYSQLARQLAGVIIAGFVTLGVLSPSPANAAGTDQPSVLRFIHYPVKMSRRLQFDPPLSILPGPPSPGTP